MWDDDGSINRAVFLLVLLRVACGTLDLLMVPVFFLVEDQYDCSISWAVVGLGLLCVACGTPNTAAVSMFDYWLRRTMMAASTGQWCCLVCCVWLVAQSGSACCALGVPWAAPACHAPAESTRSAYLVLFPLLRCLWQLSPRAAQQRRLCIHVFFCFNDGRR